MDAAPPPARRRFGQNFLVDERVVEWTVGRVADLPDLPIVEIGPGRGALTNPLAATGRPLVAVELDRDLAALQRRRFAGSGTVRVVETDALRLDWIAALDEWFPPPARTVVAGNLPYNVATPIVRALLRALPSGRVARLVLMFQREVADRLVSTGGDDYGYLSVERWLFAEVAGRREAGPEAFHPRPKVSSSVLVLEPRREPVPPAPAARALRLASLGFEHRRKLLAANLAGGLGGSTLRPAIEAALERLGHGAKARAEELPPSDFLRLAELLGTGDEPAG